MKNICIFIMAALMVLSVPLAAAAKEGVCTIKADSVVAAPGDTVTIPVRITGNPGFTNFAVAVCYDTTALKLEKIDTVGPEEEAYLCPENAAVNLSYLEQETDVPRGYVTAASSDAVAADGVLFAVTFTVLRQTSGSEAVGLELQYIRCGDVLTTVFAALTVQAEAGEVRIAAKGDVNGDGSITGEDAAAVYRYVNENLTLTEVQRIGSDVNGDGMTDTTDAALIYRMVHHTISGFPERISEEVTE